MADRQIVIAGDLAHERLSQGGNADHQESQQDGSDQDRRRSPMSAAVKTAERRHAMKNV